MMCALEEMQARAVNAALRDSRASLEEHVQVDNDAVADDGVTPSERIPAGRRCSAYFSPSITTVCPALLPPLNFTTRSVCWPSWSVALPLPSSPHWAPSTMTAGMIWFSWVCYAGAQQTHLRENNEPGNPGWSHFRGDQGTRPRRGM